MTREKTRSAGDPVLLRLQEWATSQGLSREAVAKRLGVSPRTYAGYVADLKAEYDAQTRFQLGYTMGRMGVDGREDAALDGDEGPLDEPPAE